MRALALLPIVLFLAACDLLTPADPYREQLVVSTALEAGAPLPALRLTRTVPIDRVYDTAAVAIPDAEVSITRLAPDGSDAEVYRYYYRPDRYHYFPHRGSVRVVPGATYRLDVRAPGFETPLMATTTVPQQFEVVRAPDGAIRYQTGQGPESVITPSSVPGRQAVYLLQVRALAPDAFEIAEVEPGRFRWVRLGLPDRFGLTPFYANVILGRDCTRRADGSLNCPFSPEDVVSGSSPLLNEASYVRNPDGTLVVRAPWLAFGFYGPQKLVINALDDALVRFIESQATQQPGGTLSPGEIPNVVTNVQGGLGVFGSFASRSVQLTITE